MVYVKWVLQHVRREMMLENRGRFEGGPRRACESGRELDAAVVSRIRMLGNPYNGHSTEFKVLLVHLESNASLLSPFQVHAHTIQSARSYILCHISAILHSLLTCFLSSTLTFFILFLFRNIRTYEFFKVTSNDFTLTHLALMTTLIFFYYVT